MSYIPKSDFDWLMEHAERGTDDVIRCKKTGAEIKQVITGRSIWTRPFSGGSGEVRQVIHPFCPSCGEEPNIPYGTPIYEDELREV
jgi:hypothetical protein